MILDKFYNVSIEKSGFKKVKGLEFYNDLIKRNLIIHSDVDNSNYTSISDLKTGYRLFGIPLKVDNVTQNSIDLKIEDFVKHYTIELIKEQFDKIEKLQEEK